MTFFGNHQPAKHNRRNFLRTLTAAPLGIACGMLCNACRSAKLTADTFIVKASSYSQDLTSLILAGLGELQVGIGEIKDKNIVLKPNMVEPHRGAEHIVTNPALVFAAAEALLKLGAARITIAEGAGHCRDTYQILEESGFDAIFGSPKISWVDLNYDDWVVIPNARRRTKAKSFVVAATVQNADMIISMPKLKTHHWVGTTLSMKNLFGILPGTFYGWPKNVLHMAGITQSIADLNASVRAHLAIVDGIIGMEGDGPIMGNPKHAGVIVMGRNLPAVDATCARIIGIDPHKIDYLDAVENKLGPIEDSQITQRGESWQSVRTDFALLDYIEAQRGIRL